jgi:tetratricopeptide (TPR) repeat protein
MRGEASMTSEGKSLQAADVMNQTFGSLYSAGHFEDCIDLLKREISIREQLDDPRGLANAFHNLARTYSVEARMKESEACYRRVITIARDELHDGKLLQEALCNLGAVLAKRGDLTSALSIYKDALSVQRALRLCDCQIDTLGALGYLCLLGHQPELAASYLEEGLELYRSEHNGGGDPKILVKLGRAYYDLKRIARAISAWEQAALLFREFGQEKLAAEVAKASESLRQCSF